MKQVMAKGEKYVIIPQDVWDKFCESLKSMKFKTTDEVTNYNIAVGALRYAKFHIIANNDYITKS